MKKVAVERARREEVMMEVMMEVEKNRGTKKLDELLDT